MTQDDRLTDLLQTAKQGDTEALVRNCLPYVKTVLRRRVPEQDLDDVVQDTLYRMLEKLDQVDGNGQKFKGWLARLAHNVASSYWRQRYRSDVQALPAFTDDIESCQDAKTPETLMMQQELSERLLLAIQSLPRDQRTVVALFYGRGFSTEETAIAMDRPHGTVRRMLHTARNNLRAQLEEE